MRVLSWNIDSRGRGLADRIEALEAFGADVVLLQEVPRSAAPLLDTAPGFAWRELAVLHSEPGRGAAARIGPAILGTERVVLKAVGQVPAKRFVEAGQHAGLSEAEVNGIGWRHKTIYADVEVDGHPVRVCSLHARPGTGGGRGKPYLGYAKQIFHRVCAEWLADHDGTTIVGVDANSPRVDHPDPGRWEPFMAGEATLIGPAPRHALEDALRRWLEDRPKERARIEVERPDGPLAVTYWTTGARRPRRYDHLLVSKDLEVVTMDHRPPRQDGSDHGAIVAEFRILRPSR